MNKKFIKLFLLSFLLTLTTVAVAADFRVADEQKANIHISQTENPKNLYTAGNMVSVDSNIQKGLYVVGNVINVNGSVGETIISAGNTITLNNDVNGSIHIVAGSVIINGKISDDVMIAGGNVIITENASIGGDLVVVGGTVDVKGPVQGNAYLSGGTISINNKIGGNVKIKSAEKLQIGSSAVIGGSLEYNTKKEIEITDGAVITGEITKNEFSKYGKNNSSNKGFFAFLSVVFLIKIIGMIIVGWLLVMFFHKQIKSIIKEGLGSFWESLGVGFAVLFLTPIFAVLLLITVFGIWPAFIIGAVYLLLILVSTILSGIIFGSWIIKKTQKNWMLSLGWKEVVLGITALSVIKLIPVFGWIIAFVFMLLSIGAICRVIYQEIK